MDAGPRIDREWRTLSAMIRIYCRNRHGSAGPVCPDCEELLEYAEKRLQKCPFQEEKPPCVDCPIHCYMPSRREQVKAVMRYAGPRMMWRHPVLALRHWIDSFKEAPEFPRRGTAPGVRPAAKPAPSGSGGPSGECETCRDRHG